MTTQINQITIDEKMILALQAVAAKTIINRDEWDKTRLTDVLSSQLSFTNGRYHVTATERKHIKAIIDSKQLENYLIFNVGRKTYDFVGIKGNQLLLKIDNDYFIQITIK